MVFTGILPNTWLLRCKCIHPAHRFRSIPRHFGTRLIMNPHNCRYDGDLTIRLSGGLSIRVPNNQFLVPFVDIARNGTRVTNDSLVDLLISSNGAGAMGTLGRYFLTAAYLMVDHDANKFTLWQANPSASKPNLVPVIAESTDPSCISDGTTGTPSTTATADPPPSISTGAIVGIAVGGAAGLAAFAVAFFLVVRRRRKRLAAQPMECSDNNQTDKHAKPNVLTEMPHYSVPQEMDGYDPQTESRLVSGLPQSSNVVKRPVYELDGFGQASQT